MKKALLYLLMFSYSTMLIRPVMPSVLDLIAHTFWYSQHMATVHFENGKYHVHYEYMAESRKNFPEKSTAVRTDSPASDHLVSRTTYNFSISLPVIKKERTRESFSLPSCFLASDYPPPKA
ncbi:MAG TPA: hypothetical protein VE035_01275 [Puia sp.]|nr:hypothetical protein [Puia sp.]